MKVKITSGMNSHSSKIFIDDKQIERCRAIEYRISVGEVPTLMLEVYPDEMVIDGDAMVSGKNALKIDAEKEKELKSNFSEYIFSIKSDKIDAEKEKELKSNFSEYIFSIKSEGVEELNSSLEGLLKELVELNDLYDKLIEKRKLIQE